METLDNSDEYQEQEQEGTQEEYSDWLDELSDYIERALAGIFFFVFKQVPQWVWKVLSTAFAWVFIEIPRKVIEWFKQSASFILRLGRAVLLVVALIGVLFGPLATSFFLHKFQTFSVAWFTIASVGVVWGLVTLRRQQIRSLTSKFISRLKFWENSSSTET